MQTIETQDIGIVLLGTAHHDNSGLRARLEDQIVAPRAIVAELRAAMAERTGWDSLVDLRDEATAV